MNFLYSSLIFYFSLSLSSIFCYKFSILIFICYSILICVLISFSSLTIISSYALGGSPLSTEELEEVALYTLLSPLLIALFGEPESLDSSCFKFSNISMEVLIYSIRSRSSTSRSLSFSCAMRSSSNRSISSLDRTFTSR